MRSRNGANTAIDLLGEGSKDHHTAKLLYDLLGLHIPFTLPLGLIPFLAFL